VTVEVRKWEAIQQSVIICSKDAVDRWKCKTFVRRNFIKYRP